MITSRPDLLPFARPSAIGLPYHGIVKNGTLTLPNATTMTYPQPSGGDVTLVVSPLAAAISRTTGEAAFDTAHGYQWLTHAFLSGAYDELGGQEQNSRSTTARAWLYCSDTETWRISVSWSSTGRTFSAFARRFGKFGGDLDDSHPIGTFTFVPKSYSDATLSVTVEPRGFTHSEHGDTTVFNLRYMHADFAPSFQYIGAVKIVISMVDGLPSAAFTTLASGSMLYDSIEAGTGDYFPDWAKIENINTGTTVYTRFFNISTDFSYEILECWDCPGTKHGSKAKVQWQVSASQPTSVTKNGTKITGAKFHWFVLPNGTVNNFESDYIYGYGGYGTTSLGGDVGGEQICERSGPCSGVLVNSCGEWLSQRTHMWIGETNTYEWEGVNWEVRLGTSLFDFSATLWNSRRDAAWQYMQIEPGDYCGVPPQYMWHNVPGDSLEGEISSGSTNGGYAEDIKVEIHNNNVIDFWGKEGSSWRYLKSVTITGQQFDRAGKNAVLNPLTDEIVLGDTIGQTVCIV